MSWSIPSAWLSLPHNKISIAPGFALGLVWILFALGCDPSLGSPQSNNPVFAKNTANSEGPVVLELFTSQGCSSCPPADRLLRELNARSASNGLAASAELIVLSEHVDYWNRLGWTDPYSSSEFSGRQRSYAENIGDQVYTPQMVVQGQYSMVGHSRSEIGEAIERARALQRIVVELSVSVDSNARQAFASARVADYSGPVVFLLVEDHLRNHVPRGENADRDLVHDGVVRDLQYATCADGKCTSELDLKPEYNFQNLRIVALIQDRGGPIRGAAQVSLAANAKNE